MDKKDANILCLCAEGRDWGNFHAKTFDLGYRSVMTLDCRQEFIEEYPNGVYRDSHNKFDLAIVIEPLSDNSSGIKTLQKIKEFDTNVPCILFSETDPGLVPPGIVFIDKNEENAWDKFGQAIDSATTGPANKEHVRFIYAEDEEKTAEMFFLKIEKMGWRREQFTYVTNKADLLEAQAADPGALIITDNSMPSAPGEDASSNQGLSALRELRASGHRGPIILLSGDGLAKKEVKSLGGIFVQKADVRTWADLEKAIIHSLFGRAGTQPGMHL